MGMLEDSPELEVTLMIEQAENLMLQEAIPGPEQAGRRLSGSADATEELVKTIAAEMASQVAVAVEYWMEQFDRVFNDPRLTTLGRVHALQEILDRYKRLTGKVQLRPRRTLSA